MPKHKAAGQQEEHKDKHKSENDVDDNENEVDNETKTDNESGDEDDKSKEKKTKSNRCVDWFWFFVNTTMTAMLLAYFIYNFIHSADEEFSMADYAPTEMSVNLKLMWKWHNEKWKCVDVVTTSEADDGKIVVLDHGKKELMLFDKKGRPPAWRKIPWEGPMSPVAVTYDRAMNLFVILNQEDNVLTNINLNDKGKMPMYSMLDSSNRACGLSVMEAGHFLVAQCGAQAVSIHDKGKVVVDFDRTLAQEQEYQTSTFGYVTSDEMHHIFASFPKAHKVHIFAPDGSRLETVDYGKDLPMGVTMSPEGAVLVAVRTEKHNRLETLVSLSEGGGIQRLTVKTFDTKDIEKCKGIRALSMKGNYIVVVFTHCVRYYKWENTNPPMPDMGEIYEE